MDDDTESGGRRKEYPLSPAKMSKTPSWVMLGFVLGAVTAWSVIGHLRKDEAGAAATRAAVKSAEPVTVRYAPQSVETIEAVFADWDKYAVWENDLTEVALWNKDAKAFTDCYEVLRYAGRYYFRSIPALTRREIRRGKYLEVSPLLFTETEEQYQEWRQHGRSERPVGDYRPVSAFPKAATGAEAGADEKETKAASRLPKVEIAPLPPMTAPKFEAVLPVEAGATKAKEGKKEE